MSPVIRRSDDQNRRIRTGHNWWSQFGFKTGRLVRDQRATNSLAGPEASAM